jgi:hypothetical protein
MPDSFIKLTVISDILDVKIRAIDVSFWAERLTSGLDPIVIRFEISQWFSVQIIGHSRRRQTQIMAFTDL